MEMEDIQNTLNDIDKDIQRKLRTMPESTFNLQLQILAYVRVELIDCISMIDEYKRRYVNGKTIK